MLDSKGVAFKDLCLPIVLSKNIRTALETHVSMKYQLIITIMIIIKIRKFLKFLKF